MNSREMTQQSLNHQPGATIPIDFGSNGGFVFDAIHNIQACTPVENIVAMLAAVRKFRGD